MWLKCITEAYTPDAIYRRFEYQMQHTFPNRKKLPPTPARVNKQNIFKGFTILKKIFWHVGVKADYRLRFWKMAIPALRRGDIEGVIHTAVVAHHMIMFARDCIRGDAEKCFYAEAPKQTIAAPAQLGTIEPLKAASRAIPAQRPSTVGNAAGE
jgi:hopanoid C-2 methylase